MRRLAALFATVGVLTLAGAGTASAGPDVTAEPSASADADDCGIHVLADAVLHIHL